MTDTERECLRQFNGRTILELCRLGDEVLAAYGIRQEQEVAPQCRRCERYDEVSERGLCESCESFLAEDVALERYLDGEL